ncbi:DDB1- and CUL4-associated factor 8 [Drosophila innubila]|uniref:DDB1- and CUL4-associated factor 8 n=1 Tax=Drosophila innubila TaxID=198719 RepID=UPI00148BB3BA|nr:DDB1- and CUL4-associated factor 8 [Drosophila innubila]
MDLEEDGAADAATACKRQKRNNSSDESCNEDDSEAGTSTAAAGARRAAAAGAGREAACTSNDNLCSPENRKEAKKPVNSHNNNNNNKHSGKGDDIDTVNAATTTTTTTNAAHDEDNITRSPNSTPTSSLSASQSVDEPATQVDDLTIDIHTVSNTPNSSPIPEDRVPNESELAVASSNAQDDDDTEDNELDALFPIFNRPRMLRTRSYRSTLSNSASSSTDAASDHNSDANSDTNDTEVDGDNDADGDGTDEAAEADNVEDYESRSPSGPFPPDDSSSGSSDVFWHRYYATSNEDPDSDDEYNEIEANPADKEQVEIAVNKVMCKTKPSYTWNCVQELMQREHNLFNRIGWRGGHTSVQSFGQGYYGSRQVVERMKLMSTMSRHRGCVNCLNFNRSGDLICSGSDDLLIVVWDWANGKPRHSFKSGHTLNIFQTKFIDSAGCLDIVSSSRDGHVRRAVIPPSGSSSFKPMRLYTHSDAVHKVVVVPQSRHEIMSAGEDAAVKHFDLRSNEATTMLHCVGDKRRVRLFSIAHHPYAPEFCISGSDDKLRVYDKRKLNKTVHEMTPKDIKNTKISQITCAVYNHSGSEILASYSDAGIYLFDSRNYKEGEFLHSYEGHVNSRTIKGVNFFGPHSEYIVSGSDCGHIFFWDKNTESVINFMRGDLDGVVNCLEPHPWMPVLATSGLEHHVKIWTPTGLPETDVPSTDALKETLQKNFRRSILDDADFDINQIHYFIRQLIEPRRGGGGNAAATGQERNRTNFSHTSDSSSSSNSSSSPHRVASSSQEQHHTAGSNESSSDEGNADPLGCRTQ